MMLTGRRFWTFAMVLALCVIVTAGCKRRRSKGSTTINKGSDIFTTDNFPGGAVQDGNTADDKRALSNSGQTYDGNLFCLFNGDRDVCMITYTTSAGSSSDGGLYAHYYSGGTWTPPVALRCLDADSTFNIGQAVIAFVNTENHISDNAQARDGDAVIVWKADDVDTDGAGADGVNTALFMTYFDVTFAGDISRNFGFQEFATRIDSQDEVDEDVDVVGLLTDGLCGSAYWSDLGLLLTLNDYEYGDQTTSIEIVFRQYENVDADATVEDSALYAARIALDAAIAEDIPLTPTAVTRLGIIGWGASDSGTNADETQPDRFFVTYNNSLLFRAFSNDTGPGGPISFPNIVPGGATSADNDITLQTLSIDLATGAISAIDDLHPITPIAAPFDGDENNAMFFVPDALPPQVYGPDEGLANLVCFYQVLEEEPTGTPTLINSANAFIAEISPTSGAVLEIAQISIDDVDEIDNAATTSIIDCYAQLSRNGDYIWIGWRQIVDITAGAGNDGGSVGIWAIQYITTRPDDDGFFTIPPLADTLSGIFNVGVPTTTEPCTWWGFQACLGYVCGAQSDPDEMNLFFQRSDATDDDVFQVNLDADIIPVGVSPIVTVTGFETFEDGDQPGSLAISTNFPTSQDTLLAPRNFIASDAGDGTGSGVFAVYVDDVDGTATDDSRLFAENNDATPGIGEVDSAVSFREVTQFQSIRMICTPPGSEIGRFDVVSLEDDEARPHASNFIHFFFTENRTSELYGTFALRTRQFNTSDDGLVFGDNFVPNAGTNFVDPFTMDLPGNDPSETPVVAGTAVQENTIGVWFRFLDRIYYQECSPGDDNGAVGWRHEGEVGFEVSDPALVDDDTSDEVESVEDFCVRTCVCNDLQSAMIFWTKVLDENDGDQRLQVRVRGSE